MFSTRGEDDDGKGLFIVGAHGGPVERLTESKPNQGVGVDADRSLGPDALSSPRAR